MPAEADFLAVIHEEPNDPTHLLVFADWLEERDDPRAELVRGIAAYRQTQVPGVLTPSFRSFRLPIPGRLVPEGLGVLREGGLLEVAPEGLLEWSASMSVVGWRVPWNAPWWPWVTHLRLRATAEQLREVLDQLPSPPVSVEWLVEPAQAVGSSLADSPVLQRVQVLHLLGADWVGQDSFAELLASPRLVNLRRLDVGSRQLPTQDVEALAGNAALGRLQSLFLGHTPTDRGAFGRLLRASWWSGLRELRMLCRADDGPLLRLLAGSPSSAGLRVLELDQPTNGPIDLDGLPGAAFWPGLRALSLGIGSLSTAALTRMLALLLNRDLESLRLLRHPAGPEVLNVLADCPYLERLNHLTLGGELSGSDPLRVLGASRHLGRLHSLDLRATSVGDRGLRSLGDWPHLERLRHLRLFKNTCTAAGAATLANLPGLRGLHSLDLAWAPLQAEGIRALAASPYLSRLLHLVFNSTTPASEDRAGLRALFPQVWSVKV